MYNRALVPVSHEQAARLGPFARTPAGTGRRDRTPTAAEHGVRGSHQTRTARIPFAERGGTLRGLLDVATGRYPLFLFGGPMGRMLPVFHLHEVAPTTLDRQLQHLAEHGYRTVTSGAVARFVRDGRHPGPDTVVLCFDDALSSLWTVALPLLRRYGLQAVTFAIPGRIAEAAACRPALGEDGGPLAGADSGSPPFVTWPELEALHRSGVIDVQSHSYSHSSLFCHADPIDFVTPAFDRRGPLDRPLVSEGGEPVYLSPADLGAPLFLQRSRLSDAVRFLDDPDIRRRCLDRVRERGGADFFDRPSWRTELRALIPDRQGRDESATEQERAIHDELDRARSVLNDRLRTNSVKHLCFPWGVGGALARKAAGAVGYETAFSERLFGLRAVRAGDDPYRLMRLNGKFITRLPRRRRPTIALEHPAGEAAPRQGHG